MEFADRSMFFTSITDGVVWCATLSTHEMLQRIQLNVKNLRNTRERLFTEARFGLFGCA
jgi:hypothetical protein